MAEIQSASVRAEIPDIRGIVTAERYFYTDAGAEYPESDGEPMGETEFHVDVILRLYSALRYIFRDDREMYAAADMFLYYEKGNPRAKKAPDVMVIRGVEKYKRRIFKTWEEKAVPCVIFEITSDSTKHEDMNEKYALYASLGVSEYFMFDPLRDYLKSGLRGFRLKGNRYVPVLPDRKGQVFSSELNTFLLPEGDMLHVIDPQTGRPVPSHSESLFYAGQAEARADREAVRAEQAEKLAESERQRAEVEKQRAEIEKQRAEKLAAKLRALGISPDE